MNKKNQQNNHGEEEEQTSLVSQEEQHEEHEAPEDDPPHYDYLMRLHSHNHHGPAPWQTSQVPNMVGNIEGALDMSRIVSTPSTISELIPTYSATITGGNHNLLESGPPSPFQVPPSSSSRSSPITFSQTSIDSSSELPNDQDIDPLNGENRRWDYRKYRIEHNPSGLPQSQRVEYHATVERLMETGADSPYSEHQTPESLPAQASQQIGRAHV